MSKPEGPLLLLHGFTGRSASWDAVVAALPGIRPVLAPDLPGHGDAASSAAGFDEAVDELAATVAASAPRGWHVAGYSMGGRVALALLIRHPRLFDSAVLMGASPGLADAASRRQRREEDARWAERLRRRGMAPFLRDWERVPVLATGDRLDAATLARQREVRASNRPDGLAFAMETLGLGAMPDLWPRLAGVAVPVTLMVGELDAKFRDIAGRMAAELPRSRIERVAGAGHNVVLEAPHRVAAGILRHLRLLEEEGREDA